MSGEARWRREGGIRKTGPCLQESVLNLSTYCGLFYRSLRSGDGLKPSEDSDQNLNTEI